MKTKILYIDKSKIFAGAEYSLLSLMEMIDQKEYDSFICVNYLQGHHRQYSQRGITIISRNKSLKWWMGSDFSLKSPRGTDFIKRFVFSIQLAIIIKRYKIDICHFNLLRNTDKSDIYTSKLFRCKIVGHVRSLAEQSALKKGTVDLCDSLIVTSNQVEAELKELGSKTSLKKLYDPIDIKKYDTSKINSNVIRAKYSIDSSNLILSSIAILDPRKGHDISLHVLNELLKINIKVKLFIVGGSINSIEEKRLKEIASDLKLLDNVIFTGHINEVVEIYSISDIILSLSKDGEAFGRVPLEAAAAKRIVIVSDKGASNELVKHGFTGFLVDPLNLVKIKELILGLISDYSIKQTISENAFNFVNQNFSPAIYAGEVEKLYRFL